MLKKTNYKKQICTGPAQCSEKRLLKLFAVCKIFENIAMFTKDFLQLQCYGSKFYCPVSAFSLKGR